MDADCNFLLTVFTANEMSYQITIPNINSNLPGTLNDFCLHHSYPWVQYQHIHLTREEQTLAEELEI
jgi:hypothetical protein